MRGAPALAHGTRSRRRPSVLRGGFRRGPGGEGAAVTAHESRVVYHGKLFDVTLETWDGREREIVEHPGAVCIVAVDRGGDVTPVRQLREATGGDLPQLPAGARGARGGPPATGQRGLPQGKGPPGGGRR